MGIVVLHFFAGWCQPCNTLETKFQELKVTYPNIEFRKVSIEKDNDLFQEYTIRKIPTVIIMNNETKEIIARIDGFNLPLLLEELSKLA
jgi:thioredoxin 1